MAVPSAALLAQAAVNGVLLGLVYTLASVGLSLTLGVLGIVNLAHSTFIMLGTFFALELLQRAGLDPVVAMVLAVPVFFGVGWVLERVLLRRVVGGPDAVALLVLFGLMIILESGSILVWTTDTRVLRWPLAQAMVQVGGLVLPMARVVPALLALAMVGLLDLLLRRTLLGKAMRAVGQQPDAAAIIGIDVRAISAVVVALGTASAAVGGIAAAVLFATDEGKMALDALGQGFHQLLGVASTTWQSIQDAIAAGDLAGAMEVAWLGIHVVWETGIAAITRAWRNFKSFFVELFWSAVYAVARAFNTA